MPEHSVSEEYLLGITGARRALRLTPSMTKEEMQVQLDRELKLLTKFTNGGFPVETIDHTKGACDFWQHQLQLITTTTTAQNE